MITRLPKRRSLLLPAELQIPEGMKGFHAGPHDDTAGQVIINPDLT